MKGTSTAAAKASRWGDEDEEEDASPVLLSFLGSLFLFI